MKYLTDEHIPLLLAQLLRAAGIDARTVQECGLRGQPDEQVLQFAATEDRCVVTSDGADFEKLTRAFATQNLPHAGVVCVVGSITTDQASSFCAGLVRLHQQYPDGAYPCYFDYLTRSRNS